MTGKVYQACPMCRKLWLHGFGSGYCSDCKKLVDQSQQLTFKFERSSHGRDHHVPVVRKTAPTEL